MASAADKIQSVLLLGNRSAGACFRVCGFVRGNAGKNKLASRAGL